MFSQGQLNSIIQDNAVSEPRLAAQALAGEAARDIATINRVIDSVPSEFRDSMHSRPEADPLAALEQTVANLVLALLVAEKPKGESPGRS